MFGELSEPVAYGRHEMGSTVLGESVATPRRPYWIAKHQFLRELGQRSLEIEQGTGPAPATPFCPTSRANCDVYVSLVLSAAYGAQTASNTLRTGVQDGKLGGRGQHVQPTSNILYAMQVAYPQTLLRRAVLAVPLLSRGAAVLAGKSRFDLAVGSFSSRLEPPLARSYVVRSPRNLHRRGRVGPSSLSVPHLRYVFGGSDATDATRTDPAKIGPYLTKYPETPRKTGTARLVSSSAF